MALENKNITEQIKEKLNSYEVKPSDKVWDNISHSIDTPKGFPVKKILFYGIGAAVVVSTICMAFYFSGTKDENLQLNSTNHTEQIVTKNTNTKTGIYTKDKLIHEDLINNNQSNVVENNTRNDVTICSINKEKTSRESVVNSTLVVDKDKTKNTPANNINSLPERVTQITPISTPINSSPNITISNTNYPVSVVKPNKGVSGGDNVIISSSNVDICRGESTTITVKGGMSYIWSNHETSASITVRPEETTTYVVAVALADGMEVKKQITINVSECGNIIVPTAITPDLDRNNIFKVNVNGTIPNYEIIIMSRQGQQVFHSKDINQEWDGTFRGEKLSSGTYMYIITYRNSRGMFKRDSGSVTLIR